MSLFGPTPPLSVSVFHDESKVSEWLFHGFLFVQQEYLDTVLNEIIDMYQKYGVKELHFKKLSGATPSSYKKKLAKEVFENVLEKIRRSRRIRFFAIGIQTSKLPPEFMKPAKIISSRSKNALYYEKFFEVGLVSAIRWFYLHDKSSLEKLIIKSIYTDGESSVHKTSPNVSVEVLKRIGLKILNKTDFLVDRSRKSVRFGNNKILCLDSSPEHESSNPKLSYLIQITDLLIGGVRLCYTNPKVIARTPEDFRQELVGSILNIIEDIFEDQGGTVIPNFNSPFYKKFNIILFPKSSREDLHKRIHDYGFAWPPDEFYNAKPALPQVGGLLKYNKNSRGV